MERISINSNRTLYLFNSSELLYIIVNGSKKNTTDIVLSGNRVISVHASVSGLYNLLSGYMGKSLVRISRDQCININNVVSLSSDGEMYLADPRVPTRTLKFFIPSRLKINELISALGQ